MSIRSVTMAGSIQIKKQPFERHATVMFYLILSELISIWIVTIAATYMLNGLVPTHFNLNGLPDAYGPSSNFLIIGITFSIAPIIVMLIVFFRFELVNKYPYLINMPAFYSNIRDIKPSRRSYWVNKYFEIMLAVGVYITGILLILAMGIYLGTKTGQLNSLIIFGPIALIIVVVVGLLFALRNIYRRMQAEIKQKK